MVKKILLLALSLTLVLCNFCFAEVEDVEGITVHFTEEEWAAFIAAQEKEKEEHYNTKEVIDLIRSGAFTGVLVAGYSDSPGEMIWHKCARKDSFGSRSPYNPFLEGFWVTDFCISGKHNPWYNPKYNPDYYLYGITKVQFDALSKEEQAHQIYLNGPAYVNCVLDATVNASINSNPVSALGGSSALASVKCIAEYPDNYTFEEMQTINFGQYYKNNGNTKEPLEWIVLEKSNGRALILSKYSIESVKYNNENTGITWEECTLRKWLNSDFMNIAFTDAEKQKIISTTLENKDNAEYGTKGGNNTTDNIFLLSVDDAKKYFGYKFVKSKEENEFGYRELEKNKRAETKRTSYAKHNEDANKKLNSDGYWLRGSGTEQFTASEIAYEGTIASGNVTFNNGLRPVMWISY